MRRKERTKRLVGLFLSFAALIGLVSVQAQSNGMDGYSQIGATCHSSTADPSVSVTISGIPASYTPGNSYVLQVIVTGGPPDGGGFDLSVTAGTLSTSDPNARIQNGEATNRNGNARTWTVSWTAPSAGTGTVTFYVAGIATNNDGKKSGDGWNVNTYTSNEAAPNQRPTITLTYPTGVQDWTGSSIHIITWTMSDDVTPTSSLVVYLNYSSSAGSGNIAGPLTGVFSYSWTVPNINAIDARVNATVIDGGNLKGYSENLIPKIDSTRPTVLSSQPVGSGVALATPIIVQFSESMNTTSTQAALSLLPNPGGWIYSWSQTMVPNDTLTANHAPFMGNTIYNATIGTGAKDVSSPGNTLATPYSWQFITVTVNTPPTISLIAPSGGESWSGGSVHNINWLTNDAEDATSTLKLWANYSVTGGFPFDRQIAALQGASGDSNPYSWTVPNEDSTMIVLNATIIDSQGAPGYAQTSEFEIDSTSPSVISTSPLSGAISVPINTNVLVTWSEMMNKSTVEAAFSLKDTIAWLPVIGTYSWAGSVLTFNPTGLLTPGIQYSANITVMATDDSQPGNSLLSEYIWTFTTSLGADANPPTLMNITVIPNPQEVYWPVNVSINVQDDVAVGEVFLNVTPISGLSVNMTMLYDTTSGRHYLNRSFTDLGVHTFVIWATDTSGNWNSSLGQFIIHDTTNPVVGDLRAVQNPAEIFSSVNVSALVSDNYQLSGVWIEVTAPDMSSNNLTMLSGARFYQSIIPNQIGSYNYKVTAVDSSGNWGMAGSSFTVRDSIPPVITGLTAIPNPVEVFSQTNISVVITDNYQFSEAWIKITTPDSSSTNNSMSPGSKYYFNFSPNQLGTYTYEVWASDISGNWNSSATTFISVDTTDPFAEAGPDQSVPQDTVVLFDGQSSSDNYGIANYTWSFDDGNGLHSLYGSTAQHRFPVIANVIVTLLVTDFDGNSASDQMWVNVTDGTPPTADAGPDQNVNVGDTVFFDGTESTDNVGITSYTWTLDDDGPVILSGVQVFYVFSQPGDYIVTLIVEDSVGLQDQDSLIIHVLFSDTQPPTAPLNLIVELSGLSDLRLNWNANSESDLAGYRVYRSLTAGGPYVLLNANELLPINTYMDEKLEGGLSYYYIVTAVDTSGNESVRSNEASGYVDIQTSVEEQTGDLRWSLVPIITFIVLILLAILALRNRNNKNKQDDHLEIDNQQEGENN